MEWIKIMWAKKVELLSSRKFWLATLTAVIAVIKLDPVTVNGVLTVVQIWLGAIWTVGLIQGTAERLKK